jgi:hypothetical protein
MWGVDIHAQLVAEMLDGKRSYAELGPFSARLFTTLLGLLGLVLGWRFRRRHVDFLDWRVASFGLVAADAVTFKFAHIVLPLTPAAFAWILGVTCGSQLRGAAAWVRLKLKEGSMKSRTTVPAVALIAGLVASFSELGGAHHPAAAPTSQGDATLQQPLSPGKERLAQHTQRQSEPGEEATQPKSDESHRMKTRGIGPLRREPKAGETTEVPGGESLPGGVPGGVPGARPGDEADKPKEPNRPK